MLLISPRRTTTLAAGILLGWLTAMPAAHAHEIRFGQLVIHHPWCRQSPDTADAASGFMTITNTGRTDDRLIAVSAEIGTAARIEDAKGGEVADGLLIPAGATVILKPGSLHIQFGGLTQPVEEGEEFTGTLGFAKAGIATVDYEVAAPAPGTN